MNNITAERNKLTEAYIVLLNRIGELDKLSQNEENELEEVQEVNNLDYLKEQIESRKSRMDSGFRNTEYRTSVLDKSIIPMSEIENEKDKLPRKSAQLNMDKVNGLIVYILKESGRPLSVKDIHSQLNKKLDTDVTMPNLRNNILPRACKKNSRIKRASRGFYQYTF